MMIKISNDFGDYSRQVVLKFHDGKTIQCDWELATEIAYLNLVGIETVASCSGHNKLAPIISVNKDNVEDMKKLGYLQVPMVDKTTFIARTVIDLKTEVE